MKLDCKFKSMKQSDDLIEYCEATCEKIEKFFLRPATLHLSFSQIRHECQVEAFVAGENSFTAKAKADNFYSAIDKVFDKMAKQLSRKKQKVQSYRHYESSHYGKLDELRPEMDLPERYLNSVPNKKVS